MQGLQSEAVKQPGHCSPAIEISNEMETELVFMKFLTSFSDFRGNMSYLTIAGKNVYHTISTKMYFVNVVPLLCVCLSVCVCVCVCHY